MPENEFPKLQLHPIRNLSANPAPTPPPNVLPYAELCVTSNYTFLTGASHPEEFVTHAASLGYQAVAITDTNTIAGVVRAHVAAKDCKLRFILGSRIRLTDIPTLSVFLYPTSMDSYRRLCRLLTTGKRRATKGECHLTLEDVASLNAGLLAIAMMDDVEQDREVLLRLETIFDNDRLSLALCWRYDDDDAQRTTQTVELSRQLNIPLVATNDVHHHTSDRRMLQDVLTCIRYGCTISEAGFRLHANAERHLKPPDEMHRLFAAHPQAIRRALEITERTAGFSLDQLKYEYPDEVVPAGKSSQQHLTDLTWQGALDRFPEGITPKLKAQIEHELSLIQEMNYAPYFLTVHDLVDFARTRTGGPPILCQGRGGAANSAVCFCLGVTSVDPTKFQLLFERFISKERNEPPDIDIDFEHERREEVIQYIYTKYGRDRAALTAEVISYRRRSAVRDAGKALGLSLDLVDRLAKTIEWWDKGAINPASLREMGLNPQDITLQWLARLVGELLGFPRHLSQHVGGFVITRTPLCELVPVENAAMPDRTVIEWDKDDIDAVGMLKVDVLGLGMLTCLSKALDLVNRGRGAKGQRGKGINAAEINRLPERTTHESENVSRLVDLAEGDDLGSRDLSRHSEDAQGRNVLSHQSDASRRMLDPDEHRGRILRVHTPGIHEGSSNGDRFAGRAEYRLRDRNQLGNDSRQPGIDCQTGRRGSNDPKPADEVRRQDERRASTEERPETQEVIALLPSAPLPLCPSAPSLLFLHTIPHPDAATYAMIQRADTVGVFQIESRAQMSMLPRLKPKEFYDLVIEVAIVRPGPIQGDMVHPYLRRRNKEEPIPPSPHPSFDEVLGRTLGVPLFQEQCMALAVKAAGFTPGEADQLRRAMAAWKRKGDQIYRFGQKLIDGMMANGIPRSFAERCFEQIKGFSEYGFPESHAASFALLVYASAWLKCHYPAEFAAAILNSQPMGFYAPAQLIRDAKEHNVTVRPIDVNHSSWDCTIEPDGALRLGMRLVGGSRKQDAVAIRAAVERRGPYSSLLTLWRESGSSALTFRRLAGADAFKSMNLSRQEALWNARLLRDDKLPLFDGVEEPEAEPGLPSLSPQQQTTLDYNATGLSLRSHPIEFLRPSLRARKVRPCSDLRSQRLCPNDRSVAVAGLVLVRQRPGTASGVTFITLEDETGIANLIVWRQVYERYRKQARATTLIAHGKVQREGEVVHVIVSCLQAIDAQEPLSVRSRDFH
ncbi:MAG: PHP domain-containing protein [Phycisphaeraceae bacterium]|nr:PHP domain-containing protein [Phycisphaeraceae bacterium]